MALTYPGHQASTFQTQVYYQPAPGVEGDFADHNPRSSVDAGPGGLVAGANGLIIGRFAWLDYSQVDPNGAPAIAQSFATPGFVAPAGFVHREQQGALINWLGGASMWIAPGMPVTLHQSGGFFVINNGTSYATLGMKAFARATDGAVLFGAPGSAPGAASFTGSIAAATFTGNGSVSGNQLTITTATTGTLQPGATVTGAGIPAGVKVLSQLSGTPGGLGVYALNRPDITAAANTAISATYGTLTVTALTTGTVGVGQLLTGSGVASPTYVSGLGTGTGQAGTYYVDNNTVVASTTLTGASAVETKWFATSAAGPGGLMKMSSYPLG